MDILYDSILCIYLGEISLQLQTVIYLQMRRIISDFGILLSVGITTFFDKIIFPDVYLKVGLVAYIS